MDYKIGTNDPPLFRDPGAGKWDSESTEWDMWVKKQAIIQILPHAYVIIGDDAANHMAHYLNNSGDDYTIDLEDLIDDVKNEKALFTSEMNEARKYVETLSEGVHNITSGKTRGGYITKSENKNWFFAVGGYSVWGKGTATISKSESGEKKYELDFEYNFFDRYNWDGGKKVELFGITITDKFMGEFHRQGLAKEFDMYGKIKRNIKWTGTTFSTPVISGGGRG